MNTTTEIIYPIRKSFKIKGVDVTAYIKYQGDIVHYEIDTNLHQAGAIYSYMMEEGMNTLQFLQQ